MNFKNVVKNHVAPIVLATTISGSVVAANTSVVHAEPMPPKSKNVVTEYEEKKISSDYFNTIEEAEKWLEDRKEVLESTYKITGEYIYSYPNELISEEKITIDEVYYNKEEVLNRLEELNKLDNCSCNLTIIEGEEIKNNLETINVDKTFTTMEDLNNYKDSLNGKENLNLKVEEVLGDWQLGSEEKVTNITADTSEELNEEIEKIKSKIKADETDNINYDIRVVTNSSEELIPTSIKTEKFSETFDTKEKAEEFIELKNKEVINDPNRNYEFSEICEKKVFSHNETTDINEIFSTIEERENYKKNLESEGYILSDLEETVEIHTEKESIETGNLIITNSTKLPSDSHYEVQGDFIIIKQAKGNVAVWTPTSLTNDQKTSFKKSFLSGNYDPSISESTNFVFISGAGNFDLSSIASNWGIYTIEYSDGIITLDCSKDKISHLNYGTYEKEKKDIIVDKEKYKLIGKKTIGINKTVYDLSYSLNTQEYTKKLTYTADIFKTIKTRSKNYHLTGTYSEINQEKIPKYNLKGEIVKKIYGTKYQAEISFVYIYSTKPKTDSETISAKTDDEFNMGLYSAALAGSAIGLIGAKVKTKKRKI